MAAGAFFVVSSRVRAAFALRDRENSGKHVTLGLRDVPGAVFSRSDCDPGRGGCPGGLQEAPGAAGGRPEAAGGGDFDPDGKTRGI